MAKPVAKATSVSSRTLRIIGRNGLVGDGWGGNAGKVSYGSIENCAGRKARKRNRTEVRAAIVVKKLGNARGEKSGRKVERQKP